MNHLPNYSIESRSALLGSVAPHLRAPLIVQWGYLFVALCSVAAWIVLIPSGFHGDDYILVESLSPLSLGIKRAWLGEVLSSTTEGLSDYFYRPLTFTLFSILNTFKSPDAFRFCSLSLHIGSALLVFLISRKFSASVFASFLGSLFFYFHHTAVFTAFWISSLSELLVVFFCGLSFYCYLVNTDRNLRGEEQNFLLKYAPYIAFICALFSKETAIVYPMILFIYAVIFSNRSSKKSRSQYYQIFKENGLLLFFVITILFLIIRYMAISSFLAGSANTVYFSNPLTIFKSLFRYVYDLLVPYPFHEEFFIGLSIVFFIYWIAFLVASFKITKHSPQSYMPLVDKTFNVQVFYLLCALLLLLTPLLPVIHRYQKWYLYGSLFIFSIFLTTFLTRKTLQIALIGIIGIQTSALFFYSECFFLSHRLQKMVLLRDSLPSKRGGLDIPVAVCRDVPLFPWDPQFRAAQRLLKKGE